MTEQETNDRQQEQEQQSGATPGADARQDRRDLNWHLERIWSELKELTRQVEDETRRGGKIAKLRFEIRGLRQELESEAARVGELVYEAQMAGGKRPALARVEGYDACIERMAALRGRIDAKEEEIATLRGKSDGDTDA